MTGTLSRHCFHKYHKPPLATYRISFSFSTSVSVIMIMFTLRVALSNTDSSFDILPPLQVPSRRAIFNKETRSWDNRWCFTDLLGFLLLFHKTTALPRCHVRRCDIHRPIRRQFTQSHRIRLTTLTQWLVISAVCEQRQERAGRYTSSYLIQAHSSN